MSRKQILTRRLLGIVFGVLCILLLTTLGTRSMVTAQGETPAATATPNPQTITYIVQAGDTLTRIANRYGVTVAELVERNDIEDPDLIFVDQVLVIYVPEGWEPSPTPPPFTGPLAFTWALVDWQPADPDYVATITIQPQGGQPPYTFYHDGLVQQADTFEVAWRRCRPKPGSVGVADASGTYVKEDYWLLAPYCPVGVEILEPEEGAHLKHADFHFNVIWQPAVDPAPARYGMEIDVWENGDWHPWKRYEQFSGELFFVPDVFPGDLAGRVRMWGIYEGLYEGPKTPWRYFEFRVTH